MAEKRRFVGKKAQHEMHMACNSQYWYGAAADEILFYTIMKGACLPVPDLIAIAAAGRSVPRIPNLVKSGSMAAMLRRPELYPLFMKEVAGKFSLSVISAMPTTCGMTRSCFSMGDGNRQMHSLPR